MDFVLHFDFTYMIVQGKFREVQGKPEYLNVRCELSRFTLKIIIKYWKVIIEGLPQQILSVLSSLLFSKGHLVLHYRHF